MVKTDILEVYARAVEQFEKFAQEYGARRVRCRFVLGKVVWDSYGDLGTPRRALYALTEAPGGLRATVTEAWHRDGVLVVHLRDHLNRLQTEYYIAELF